MSDREFHVTIRHSFLASSSSGLKLLQRSRSLMAKLFLFAATVLLLLAAAGSVRAAPIPPFSGNPTGDASLTGNNATCTWTATLNPNPALQMTTCPWMTNALAAQGFDADGLDNVAGNADDWTVAQGAALNGNVTIREYRAWVTTQPTYDFGGQEWGGEGPFECYGGAVLSIQYNPGPGDPANLLWIQAIRTNDPSAHGNTWGFNEGGGYRQYLDNAGKATTDPRYPSLPDGASNSIYFLDIPARGGECPYSVDWDAQVFLCAFNAAARTITIYEKGIWWGFTLVCVPEPASLLTFLGLAVVAMRRRLPAQDA